MSGIPEQPEPCLGRTGMHMDREGRCYSRIACSVFGFCRERAVHHKGPRTVALENEWKVEAARAKTVAEQSRP